MVFWSYDPPLDAFQQYLEQNSTENCSRYSAKRQTLNNCIFCVEIRAWILCEVIWLAQIQFLDASFRATAA